MGNSKIYLYKRIVDTKLYIDKHCLENINIDNIVLEACLSNFHFYRSFRQTCGITPHRYLTRLEIEKDMELLEEGATISQTCYLLGFLSLSSFNKLSRQHLKTNPSVYSREAKDLRHGKV